jgi:hypothetical protein
MQQAHSRCRGFRYARALMPVLAGLAAFSISGIAPVDRALAQTSPSTSLSGVFEPDLAEVTSAGLAALKGAAEKAKAAADCYPSRVTFTALAPMGPGEAAEARAHGQPYGWNDFTETLSNVRANELQKALAALGYDPSQVKVSHAGGNSDDVQINYDKFKPDDDKDPPRLKVTSKPPKGTKVKAGDKIEVTIIASERYKDGHKSWPTGVQMIQLVADDGLVDSKQYGRPPQPCARQTFVVTYTVPKNPPAIVHLHALAEDGVGHQSGEDAEFPLGDVWKGQMHAEAAFIVDKQRCTDRWDVEMTVVATNEGKATGEATAKRASDVKCTHQYPVNQTKTVVYRLEGNRERSALHLRFVPKTYQPPGSIDVTAFGSLLQGHGTPNAVDIPIVSPGDARGHIAFKRMSGPNNWNVSGEASLKCMTC